MIKSVLRRKLSCGFCHCDGLLRRFHTALAFHGRSFNNWTAQLIREFFGVDMVAVFPNNVHHIQRNDHRNPHFRQLGRQIQVTLNIGTIYQIQNDVRFLLDEVISGYYLLQCVGG